MRSSGATWLALCLSVVSLTKLRIARLAGPSFHEGRGSLCAHACPKPSSSKPSAAADLTLHERRRQRRFIFFPFWLNYPTGNGGKAFEQILTHSYFRDSCPAQLSNITRSPITFASSRHATNLR